MANDTVLISPRLAAFRKRATYLQSLVDALFQADARLSQVLPPAGGLFTSISYLPQCNIGVEEIEYLNALRDRKGPNATTMREQARLQDLYHGNDLQTHHAEGLIESLAPKKDEVSDITDEMCDALIPYFPLITEKYFNVVPVNFITEKVSYVTSSKYGFSDVSEIRSSLQLNKEQTELGFNLLLDSWNSAHVGDTRPVRSCRVACFVIRKDGILQFLNTLIYDVLEDEYYTGGLEYVQVDEYLDALTKIMVKEGHSKEAFARSILSKDTMTSKLQAHFDVVPVFDFSTLLPPFPDKEDPEYLAGMDAYFAANVEYSLFSDTGGTVRIPRPLRFNKAYGDNRYSEWWEVNASEGKRVRRFQFVYPGFDSRWEIHGIVETGHIWAVKPPQSSSNEVIIREVTEASYSTLWEILLKMRKAYLANVARWFFDVSLEIPVYLYPYVESYEVKRSLQEKGLIPPDSPSPSTGSSAV